MDADSCSSNFISQQMQQKLNEESEIDQNSQVKYKSKSRIILICCNLALGFCYFGYCLAYFGAIPIATMVDVYNIDIDQAVASGLLNGCIPFGGLFGALGSFVIISRLSRRKSLIFVNICAMVTGALIYIPNFYTLILFRFLQGYWVGSFTALISLNIKEISPRQLSGSLGSLVQLLLGIGVTLAFFLNYCLKKIFDDVTGQSFWQVVFAFPFLILSTQLSALLFIFPYETPKYYLLEGKEEEAKKLLMELYKPQFVEQILEQKKKDIQTIRRKELKDSQSLLSDSQTSQTVSNTAPRNTRMWLPLVVGVALAISQQLSGINTISVYCEAISVKLISGELGHLMSSFISIVKTIGTLIASFVLHKVGRKTIILLGFFSLGIGSILLTIGFYLIDDSPQVGEKIIIVGYFFFVFIFGFSLGPCLWLYMAQIIQPRRMPITTAAQWIGSAMVIILFPIFTDNILGGNPWKLYIFFAIWNFGSLIFNYFFLLETKNKTEKEIHEGYLALSSKR